MPAVPDQPNDLLRRLGSLERRLAAVERGRRSTLAGQLLGANGLGTFQSVNSADNTETLIGVTSTPRVFASTRWPYYPTTEIVCVVRMAVLTGSIPAVVNVQNVAGDVLGQTDITLTSILTPFSVTGDLTNEAAWDLDDPITLHLAVAITSGTQDVFVNIVNDHLPDLSVFYG